MQKQHLFRSGFLLAILIFLVTVTNAQAPQQKIEIGTSYGKIIVKLYNETPKHRDNFIKLVKQGFYDSLLFHRVIPSFIIQGGDPLSKHAAPDVKLGDGENGHRIAPEMKTPYFHKRGALSAARDNAPDLFSSDCQFFIVQGRVFTIQELNKIANSINITCKQQLFSRLMSTDTMNTKINDFVLRGDKTGLHTYMLSMQPVVDSMYAPLEFSFNTEQVITYTQFGGAPNLDRNYTVFGEVVEGMEIVDKISTVKRDANDRPIEDLRIKMRLIK